MALTFDACEDEQPRGYDAKITEILKASQVPATIFLGGKWVESHPAAARELGSCPLFELGNHSYLHPDFSKISLEHMREEILRTQKIVEKATGQRPRLFRFPFGRYTRQALQVVEELGLKSIQWDVVTGDPDPNIKAADIEREVFRLTRGGSIIIMHINGRGWHTAEALPKIIKGLREKGFEFVTVSQLLLEKP
ncbi:MAG: polysaccharide deacetylase family protein [Firmicutes bacterium]|nr:polysaccharide deacetylase family protein [Bacillota bacterium]MCL5040753.1 polysaccharide deacetylase family protein [Bacillota bacterium]